MTELKDRPSLVTVLGNRTYRHLFAAQVIALVGTGLMTVALGLLAFQIAGNDPETHAPAKAHGLFCFISFKNINSEQ